MLYICAIRFTAFLYKQCSLPVSHQAVYIYGSELFFSTFLSITSILLISFLMGEVISGILFILIFCSLRIFVGGFHASTYGHCFLLTNGVFLATFVVSMLLEIYGPSLSALILILSITVIWVLAPIRNKHHPLSEKTYKKNQTIGRVLAVSEGWGLIFIDLLNPDFSGLYISTASIAAVALMMIVPKLVERGGIYHE